MSTTPARVNLGGAGWRFLLPADSIGPSARFAVSGGGDELATTLVDLGFAGSVEPMRAGVDAVDCAVRLAGGQASMDDLAAAVQPGGTVLMMVDRRERGWRTTSPRRVTARAEAAGLGVDAVYLAAPTVTAPRRFVPLDDPTAHRWYWHRLFIAGTPGLAVMAVVARALLALRATTVLGALAPGYCVICRAGGASSGRRPAMVTATNAAAEGTTWASVALLSSDQDAASRAVLVAFEPGADDPAVVWKAASHPRHNARTLAETERLTAVRDGVPAHLAAAIPRPLGDGDVCGVAVISQTAMPGPTLARASRALRLGRRVPVRDLLAVVEWLADFQRATSSGSRRWDPELAQSALLEPLADLVHRHCPPSAGSVLMAHAEAASAGAAGVSLPLVVEHLDLAPVNVLLGPDGVGVVDWELDQRRLHAPGAGLPGRDLLFLVTMWYFAVRRADGLVEERRWLHHLLAGSDDALRLGAWLAIDRYLHALGLERSVLDLLQLSLWVERAEHHTRRWADVGGDPNVCPPEVERSLAYLGVLSGQ